MVKYLEFLAARNIDVPRPMGRDDRGRQILEYMPGTLAMGRLPLNHATLTRIGHMIRRIHDASEAFVVPADEPWHVLIPVREADLICHNDLAPWNLIMGERWVFIDWDGSGPSTRLWDLAYAAQSFAQLARGEDPTAAAARLRAFIDGYDADDQLREDLPETMELRCGAMHDVLHDAHRAGDEPWASMYLSGHGDYWEGARTYISGHRQVWRDALLAGS